MACFFPPQTREYSKILDVTVRVVELDSHFFGSFLLGTWGR